MCNVIWHHDKNLIVRYMCLYNGKIEMANHDINLLLFKVLQLANVNCPPNVVVNWNEFILTI